MATPTMPRHKSSDTCAAIYRAALQFNVSIEQVIEAMQRGKFEITPMEEVR
ncbi:MAG: hypothetical protein PHQ60_16600 [Sideroxydans sp.]|nr:hypothetical protein [Sideroxydans sp.]